MKFVPVLLSALFLATVWLTASASPSRHPRQLRVPLPLPTPSPSADRRKSALFPRMGATFVVTERAHKMAPPIKMAPMKRTNALLPNLNLKQRIMGGTTKRMTDPGPIPGIAARPVVIRPFNLTKPTLAIASTTRTPLVITRRPLVRIPTLVDAGAKVTVETPSLSTRTPNDVRPLINAGGDNTITSETPVVTRRPIHRLPNRADSVSRRTEEIPVIATKRPTIKPHFRVDGGNEVTVTRRPILKTTNHVETDKATEATPLVLSNDVDSDSKMTGETTVKSKKRPTIMPNFHMDASNKLTVTSSPMDRTTDHVDTDIKIAEENSFPSTKEPGRFTTQSDSKTTRKSATEETTTLITKRPTLRPHTQLVDNKYSKISTEEKVSLPSSTKRSLLKSPDQLIYNKDDGKIVTTEALLVSTNRQPIEGDSSMGTTKSEIVGTPVVETMSSLIQQHTRSEGAEDISEGTPLVRVKRLQVNGASFNTIVDSRIQKRVSSLDTGMPGGLSHRDWWWW